MSEPLHVSNRAPNLPEAVTLIEVGPRDGFQSETKIIPTALKADIIQCLGEAGMTTIQITSFVNPKRMPQMADADLLPAKLPQKTGVTYNALVLNKKGLARAIRAGIRSVEISASASDTHSRKNTGRSRDAAIEEALEMIDTAQCNGLQVRAGVQCAFGCVYEGSISREFVFATAQKFLSQGIHMLALSDTTGMATPGSVRKMLGDILPAAGNIPVVLHLHDTRALGYANLKAAMESGVRHFDTSLSGMGGCPFVPGAAGNISTEKTAAMLSDMGIRTGLDTIKLRDCASLVGAFLAE